MTKTLKFRPRARIIRTIGDRLISGPIAAIIELIKNSHDADASFSSIKLIPPLVAGKGSIIIEDDGHGMSLEDIQTKWMEPATTDKQERKSSPKGRKLLGSKGIGRFASSRLGHSLTLETVSDNYQDGRRYKATIKDIKWNVFDDKEYLDEVEFNYDVIETEEKIGTKLIIKQLRDNWTENSIKELYSELRKMISPLPKEQDDFKIYLDLDECTESANGFNGSRIIGTEISENEKSLERWQVKPLPLLNSCDYEVKGHFDEKGTFKGSVQIKRGGLKAENIEIPAPPFIETDEGKCGLVLVHFYIFDRDRDAVMAMVERAHIGSLTYKEARLLLDEVVGVTIYRDDYRIRPYGDRENDWLGLDRLRVQNPSMRIGHDQVSGIVIVDDEEKSGLIERSSREGLEETPEFRRLKRLINNLFTDIIGPQRHKFRKKINPEHANTTSFSAAKTAAKLAWVDELIEKLPPGERQAANDLAGKKSAKLVRYLVTLEEKQAILEAKVTLGQIVAEVVHEGRTPVQYIQTETARLASWWPRLFDDTKEAIKNRAESPRIIRGLVDSAEKLRSLFNTIKPLAGIKRGQPRKYDPVKLVSDVSNLFYGRTQKYGIEINIYNKDGLHEMVGYKQDLQTALSNLIDNSLYWLIYNEIKNPEINIELYKKGSKCQILFSDNGSGIPEQYKNDIFDVGFTLKEQGTGLGLAITSEALSRSGGSIELNKDTKKKLEFNILIPLEI